MWSVTSNAGPRRMCCLHATAIALLCAPQLGWANRILRVQQVPGTLCRLSPAICKMKKIAAKVVSGDTGKRKPEEEGESENQFDTKPLMSPIDLLRTELCWDRHNLNDHLECLEYLGIHCEKESTGKGICKKFRVLVHDRCEGLEDVQDSVFRKKFCEVAGWLRMQTNDTEAPITMPSPMPSVATVAAVPAPAPAPAKPEVRAGLAPVVAPQPEPAPTQQPMKLRDSDADGIPDQNDTDRDNDGFHNEDDMFPLNDNEWKDNNGIDIREDSDPDRDGDGVSNKEYIFPDDPRKWKDSGGDGIGDNSDDYPFKKDCYTKTRPCASGSLPDKARKGLPPQGYDEFHPGVRVRHSDDTVTGDWGKERPHSPEAEKKVLDRICKKHPDNPWCQDYRSRLGVET